MYRLARTLLTLALTVAFASALVGCASTAKKAGKAAATTTVQGAKTGAKATARGAQAVGGAAVGAVTPDRER